MSNTDINDKKNVKLLDMFQDLFSMHGGPEDAAMFENRKPSQDDFYYFSPGCATFFSSVLKSFSASECEAPASDEVTLLVSRDAKINALLKSPG